MKIKKSLHIPQLYLKLKISNDTNHAHGESFKLKNTVALKHHHVQIMHRHNFDSADQRTFTVSLTLCIKLMQLCAYWKTDSCFPISRMLDQQSRVVKINKHKLKLKHSCQV